MQKALKTSSLVLVVVFVLASVVLLALGGMVPLYAIATGILAIYYGVLYLVSLVIHKLRKPFDVILVVVLCVLFSIPILLPMYDLEGVSNFLLRGIRIDMK